MKIRIEFDFNEAVMFKEMIHTALKCAAKGGLKMNKTVDNQMEEVDKFVGDGVVEKEFDSFLVVNFFEGLDRIGVWAAQTLEMAKDLAKIDKVYDKYMKEYLDSKKAKKEAE